MTVRFDIDLGFNTLRGVLTLHPDHLQVEWRRYDMMETPVTELESIAVPYTDLDAVAVRRSVLRPTIRITAKKASTFAPIPLPAGDLAILRAKIARTDRRLAEAWEAEAGLRIAEAMAGGNLLGED
jgi:hypothetical protein